MHDSSVYLHIEGFEGFDREIDFDKIPVRRAMRRAGQIVARNARQRVSQRGPSKAGEYPGRQSGLLRRSIQYTVSRSGFLAHIAPRKIAGMKTFYPAYLYYGVRAGPRLVRRNRSLPDERLWRIAPRKNYMKDALQDRQSEVQRLLREALARALCIQ